MLRCRFATTPLYGETGHCYWNSTLSARSTDVLVLLWFDIIIVVLIVGFCGVGDRCDVSFREFSELEMSIRLINDEVICEHIKKHICGRIEKSSSFLKSVKTALFWWRSLLFIIEFKLCYPYFLVAVNISFSFFF